MKHCLFVLAGLIPMTSLPISAVAQSSCATYEVQTGDTLSSIAQSQLGDSSRFSEILAANAAALPSGANVISPGLVLTLPCDTAANAEEVSDSVIAAQRAALAANTDGQGFGPQSPRDLTSGVGENMRRFSAAPDYTDMNLCNIHFHEGAEHRGGRFTTYLGNGDGAGYGTGFGYDGDLTPAELAPLAAPIGNGDKGLLEPGMTIEVHYVHTTAQVTPGPTLGSCLSEALGNPQLRVETQVMVLVNDPNALSFVDLAAVAQVGGYWQAPNLPNNTGTPIAYDGSTTGPSYNEAGSPLQVSWSVRPNVIKVDISSVDAWYADNIFDEDNAHGVRNLVLNPRLLSPFN